MVWLYSGYRFFFCIKMFQNIKITTYNKLVVNYDTYEFTPSNYSQIVINDPWYIDTSSAPDFIQIDTNELCDINIISMPEDVYSVSNYEVYNWHNGSTTAKVFTSTNTDHETMIKSYIRQFYGNTTKTRFITLDYFVLFDLENNSLIDWSPCYPSDFTPDKKSAILLPVQNNVSYKLNQAFPLVKTITITLNLNEYSQHVPEHTINYQTNNLSDSNNIYIVPEGNYTFASYMNMLTSKESLMNVRNTPNVFQYYKYFWTDRFLNNKSIQWFGSGPEITLGTLHCYPVFNKMLRGHQCVYSANNRCMTLSSGNWNVDDLITYVNDSSHSFSLSSDDHYIYIHNPCSFIINPVCNIVDEVTDITETFAKKKILCAHPKNKILNVIVTYKGVEYTVNERLTPAEFLLWLYNNLGVKCRIKNNTITCLDNLYEYNLSVSNNPLFEFKEFGIVVNKCNLRCHNYKVNIDNNINIIANYSNYGNNIIPYDYSAINISNNILTGLNHKVKMI